MVGVASTAAALLFVLLHAAPYAGGADMFGYLSQSRDHLRLQVRHAEWVSDEQVASLRYFPRASGAPLGYVYRADVSAAVPVYPPGAPLLMAPFVAVIDARGGNVVTAIAFVALLIGTWQLGRTQHSVFAATFATVLLVLSPVVLLQTILPMSDILAAALWLWSLLLSTRPHLASRPLTAGALAGLAVLVRPNTGPLLLVIAYRAWVRGSKSRALLVLCGALPAGVALLAWNLFVYGAPLRFGYGSLESLFATAYFSTNVIRYGRWLWETMGFVPFIGLAGIAWDALAATTRARDLSMLAFVIVTSLLYLFYLPWPDWPFLRFLLPCLPMLLTSAMGVVERATQRLPRPGLAVAVVLLVSLWWELHFDHTRKLRLVGEANSRYEQFAEGMSHLANGPAFALARLHSGSLRYYAAIDTIRWDLLSKEELASGITAATHGGLVPLLIVDSEELGDFEQLFGRLECWADLDRPLHQVHMHSTVRAFAAQVRCP